MKKFICFLSLAFLLLPALAFSTTIINSVANYDVPASQLAGMQVSINSGSGFGPENIWTYDSNTGFSGFTDSGSGWSIKFTGNSTDKSGLNWVLTSTATPIYGIKINAYGDEATGAHNFFDIVYDYLPSASSGNEYTPRSDQGFWYPNVPYYNGGKQGIKNSSGTVNASTPEPSHSLFVDQGRIPYYWEFTDPVLLKGDQPSPPYGDLYTTLEIDFTKDGNGDPLSNGGPLSNKTFSFGADTDVAAVPAPATLLLLGSGLLVIGAMGRKKIHIKHFYMKELVTD